MAAMHQRVTIKDVARLAGVAHTTVSRVIRNRPFIRDETRIRVARALQELNYQPNLVARSLVRKRSNVIALITTELHPYTHPIVRGVSMASIRSDYAIMLIPTDTWLEEDRSISLVAQNWQVDGIVVYNIFPHANVPDKVRQIQADKIPIVFVNKFLDQKRIHAVGIDNEQCARRYRRGRIRRRGDGTLCQHPGDYGPAAGGSRRGEGVRHDDGYGSPSAEAPKTNPPARRIDRAGVHRQNVADK
ncbi:MAG: LacI family DNA-binding transcriptional regulator [bacterium]